MVRKKVKKKVQADLCCVSLMMCVCLECTFHVEVEIASAFVFCFAGKDVEVYSDVFSVRKGNSDGCLCLIGGLTNEAL